MTATHNLRGMAPDQKSLDDLRAEMIRARTKFPNPRLLVTALGEEIGELSTEFEMLGLVHPRFVNLIKHMGDLNRSILQRKPPQDIRKEALQVACVAMRIYEEGDPIYDDISDEAAQP